MAVLLFKVLVAFLIECLEYLHAFLAHVPTIARVSTNVQDGPISSEAVVVAAEVDGVNANKFKSVSAHDAWFTGDEEH
jgi:hypothetical protein